MKIMKMKYLISSVLDPMQSSQLYIKQNECQKLASEISFMKVTIIILYFEAYNRTHINQEINFLQKILGLQF